MKMENQLRDAHGQDTWQAVRSEHFLHINIPLKELCVFLYMPDSGYQTTNLTWKKKKF